ncbi:MAG: hypothetical protein ABFR53_10635, partial [Actinomycetota bacterium]
MVVYAYPGPRNGREYGSFEIRTHVSWAATPRRIIAFIIGLILETGFGNWFAEQLTGLADNVIGLL